MNTVIFQYLNNLSANPIVEALAPLFADLPIFFLPLFLVVMWLYYSYKKSNESYKITLLYIFYSAVIAIIISLIIQQFVDIDRPETAITGAWKLLLDHLPDASFPSDHASVSVAFLTALFLSGFKRLFWAFLPWVILMNLSRVIAWVHWPLDIIVWSIVWILWALISFKLLRGNKFASKLNFFIIKTLSYIKL